MNNTDKLELLVSELKKRAKGETVGDMYKDDPWLTSADLCGGNYDDAINIGHDSGQTYLSRILLEKVGEQYDS